MSQPSPLWLSDELEYLPAPVKFSHIAALHSELAAVTVAGQLYQWRWSELEAYRHPEVRALRTD